MSDMPLGQISFGRDNNIALPSMDVMEVNRLLREARDKGFRDGYARGWVEGRAVIGGAILQLAERADNKSIQRALKRAYTFIQKIDPPDVSHVSSV